MMKKSKSYQVETNSSPTVATVSECVSASDKDTQNSSENRREIDTSDTSFKKFGAFIPARYVLAFMGFWGFFMAFTIRVNLSVAMVAMVNRTTIMPSNASSNRECPLPSAAVHSSDSNKEGEFDWDSDLQGIILGAFFYGYVVTQIPGGLLAQRCGAKWLLAIANLVSMVLAILSPMAARWSVAAFAAVRVIQGLFQGIMYPAMHTLITTWIPKQELTLMSTLIYSGALFGTVFSVMISGLLCDSSFLGGWPASFYVFGFVGLVWFFLWIFLAYDTPASHPRIMEQELLYIKASLNKKEQKEKRSPPWCAMLKSAPVWAVAAAHFGSAWGFYTLFTQLPTFQKTVLHFNNTEIGLASGFPYLIRAVCGWITSYFTDVIRRRGYISTLNVRKWSNSIALFGSSLCLLGVILVKCDRTWHVVLIAVAMATSSLTYSGFMVIHMEIAPNFAGTLMGITNTLSNFAGFLAPYIIGHLTQNGGTLHQWSIGFYISISMQVTAAVVFHIWASADLQPWA